MTHERHSAGETLFQVKNLNVGFRTPHGYKRVVRDFELTLRRGETLAIVGESGSGKTVATRALIGLAGDNAVVAADVLRYKDTDLRQAGRQTLKKLRGAQVGYVLQDALVSLDPLQPIRNEIAEPLDAHARLSKAEIRERTIQLLTEVGVPQPEIRKDQYPGELSGGLRQRALIATALALHPPVIIADEPTTALDVVVQAQVLGVLAQLIARGTSLILISHDLAVVARLADRILVMKSGIIVESGTRDEVLGNPQHAYTKALIQAVPSGDTRGRRLSPAAPARIGRPRRHGEAAENDSATPILEAKHLSKSFHGPDGRLREAVADVSFELFKGEVLGIVGASGSGKSTLARLLLALTDYDAGAVLYRGLEWPRADDRTKRRVRGKISVVYQDPYSSFDPRWNVGRILEDALRLHAEDGHAPQRADLLELLEAVGLNESHLRARPRHLSGGQRQRVAIARALAVHPEILILDEAVSALDVSIQAQILDLLEDLKARYSLSILFISHDLGVIHHIADRVLVMKDGAVVEEGDADAVFHAPRHRYTQELVAALPHFDNSRGAGRHP
ncbi:ABC transporter [Azotobacter vinelandii CA]|uniref:ABC transporter n=2 Tax=Azotobacter vinelandii TaxID=354 RepID=C1DHN3_AZOVD|nr:ABC transporter ATP-binding protein [Azotobacter vinelandii]ACO78628.1 ABC transporter [Azotobacter vinelandii DJ]AGK16685.1 ABC transporter [Azotobacter vinelandii CA]AGK20610.1 ABC transporter [Azotobacter vinelandii CA6]SFX90372.1 peptide/nickel transport system ATP-binding protein [Azotobacter vinelandii]GLK58204.1 ABC transporter ATP-binding protein [Azotobacter vinelandii]